MLQIGNLKIRWPREIVPESKNKKTLGAFEFLSYSPAPFLPASLSKSLHLSMSVSPPTKGGKLESLICHPKNGIDKWGSMF